MNEIELIKNGLADIKNAAEEKHMTYLEVWESLRNRGVLRSAFSVYFYIAALWQCPLLILL